MCMLAFIWQFSNLDTDVILVHGQNSNDLNNPKPVEDEELTWMVMHGIKLRSFTLLQAYEETHSICKGRNMQYLLKT